MSELDALSRRAYANFLRRLRKRRQAGWFPTMCELKSDAIASCTEVGGKVFASWALGVALKTVYNHLPRDEHGDLMEQRAS